MSKFLIFISVIFLSISSYSQINLSSVKDSVDKIELKNQKFNYLFKIANEEIIKGNYDISEKIDSIVLYDFDSTYVELQYMYFDFLTTMYSGEGIVESLKNAVNLYEKLADMSGSADLKVKCYTTIVENITKGKNITLFLDNVERYDEYIDKYSKREIKDSIKHFNYLGKYYYEKSRLYKRLREYENAAKMFSIAMDASLKSNDSLLIGRIYFEIGNLLQRTKKFDESLVNLKLSKKYTDELPSSNSIGAVYLELNQLDSAKRYIEKALDKYNDPTATVGIYSNLGLIYKKQKDYDKAIYYYEKAVNLRNEYIKSQPIDLMRTSFRQSLEIGYRSALVNLSSIYFDMGNIQKAKQNALLSISDTSETLHDILVVGYQNIYLIYESEKNYKDAFKYYKKYNTLKDKIFNSDVEDKLNQVNLELKTERQENDIAMLQKENELKTIKENKQELFIKSVVVVSFLIILGFIIVLYITLKRKAAEKALFLKTEEYNRNEILSLMKAQEMDSLNSFMEGQDTERKKIASDLHDRLGSLLSTIKLYFSTLESKIAKNDDKLQKTFNQVISLVDKSVDEVRSVSHNLANEDVVHFGILKAVEDIEKAINSSGRMKMHLVNDSFEFKLNSEEELQLFKAIQEMITNAVKHSGAENISVQFSSISDVEANIIVEDDGSGIKDLNSGGIGMKNIHDRLNEIGAELTIDSSPKNGTTLIISLKNDKKVA